MVFNDNSTEIGINNAINKFSNKKKKVFLGGTCNNSKWREELIPLLNVDYFNPVVDDWTPECQKNELKEREICDIMLYTITPKMKGCYSIAEVTDDSHNKNKITIFCLLDNYENEKFEDFQLKSLDAVGRLIKRNGGMYLTNLKNVAALINNIK